jgi:hypothetical protein
MQTMNQGRMVTAESKRAGKRPVLMSLTEGGARRKSKEERQQVQPTQNTTPAAQMSIDEFAASTLIVPVRPTLEPAGVDRLGVPPAHSAKMNALRAESAAAMKSAGATELGQELINRLLQMRLVDDLWYQRLPNGRTLILVKEDVYQQLPEREIAEQVHKAEVDAAVMRGDVVPDDLIRYYRHKPAPELAPSAF